MREFRALFALSVVWLIASAHIGSPDVWYEGEAGPYHVVVQIVTPGVVPGVARVFVRIPGGAADQVTVQANRYDAIAAAPPPELTTQVEGDPTLFAGDVWIMTGGSNSVTVNIAGRLGSGKAVVPAVVVASRRLPLDPKLGFALAAVGAFLFLGLVSIVGAAVRESSLAPGEAPDAKRRWKARMAMAISTAIVALALFGGSRWWAVEDTRFGKSIYKPLAASASVEASGGTPVLHVRIADSTWIMRNDTIWLQRRALSHWSPLIPDHGKIIHVFLIREPDLSAFAHLHPTTADSVDFSATLPPLPAGKYRVYGDIVHESGFSETLSSTVFLAQPVTNPARLTDSDDASSFSATPLNDSVAVTSGVTVKRLRSSVALTAGVEAPLTFSITDKSGRPVSLEPYIGMAGHAVVARDDGSVFVHLHPSGTISMASQMAITMRNPGDSVAGRLGQRIAAAPTHSAPIAADGVVSFPYAFPRAGSYHMWIQVKHGGRIITGAFQLGVRPTAH